MASKKCPVCGVSVKVENLERHVRNQHPRAEVAAEALLTTEEKQEVQKAKSAARPGITPKGVRLVAVIAAVIAVVLVLAIWNPFAPVGPGIGQVAPDFSVRTTSGGTVTLSSYRGFPVVLEFMDPDCPACRNEAPTLVSLYQNYSATTRFLSIDVDFVGVGSDDDAELIQYADGYGARWSFAIDTTKSIYRAYGVSATPTTFILDRAGVVKAILLPPGNTYGDFVSALNQAGA